MLNKPTTALDDGSYGTALMVACYRDKADIVSRLLQIPGLDTDYQDPDYGLSAVFMDNSQCEHFRPSDLTNTLDY